MIEADSNQFVFVWFITSPLALSYVYFQFTPRSGLGVSLSGLQMLKVKLVSQETRMSVVCVTPVICPAFTHGGTCRPGIREYSSVQRKTLIK